MMTPHTHTYWLSDTFPHEQATISSDIGDDLYTECIDNETPDEAADCGRKQLELAFTTQLNVN